MTQKPAPQPFVRRCVHYALTRVLVTLPPHVFLADYSDVMAELNEWVREVCSEESDVEVVRLATASRAMLAHHAAASTLPRAGIVHRLDKDTSGLMVVGKTLAAVTALTRQIAARDVHRIYLALCHGRMDLASQRIEAPIGRDPRSRIRMAVVGSGKPAMTDVQRLSVWQDADGAWVSAVRCKLGTGRTHQIRVHLSSVGHPLLADVTYGGLERLGLKRQALHATRLGFAHPVSGESMTFEAALPSDLLQAWMQVSSQA